MGLANATKPDPTNTNQQVVSPPAVAASAKTTEPQPDISKMSESEIKLAIATGKIPADSDIAKNQLAKFAEEERKAKAVADAKAAEEKKKADEVAAKIAEQEKNTGSIGMNSEEFKQAFNAATKELQLSYNIKNITMETGPVQDSFQVKFSNNMILLASVNKKDGSLREASIIYGGSDGTTKSAAELFLMFGAMVVATNPEFTPDERGSVLRDLGFMDKNIDFLNMSKSTIRNGIRYSFKSSQKVGIWFTVSDANEKR